MAENIVINDVTYNGVEAVALENGNGETKMFYPDAVRYNPQTLTDAQKTQARTNIGAASAEEVSKMQNTIADYIGEEIPDYWYGAFTDSADVTYTEYLTEKIETIKALHRQYGRDCFSIVHIADAHYTSNLGKRSPLLARKIMDETQIKHALVNGDMQTRGCHNTKEELLEENELILKMFKPILEDTLFQRGNHDGAYGRLDRDGDGDYDGKDSSGNYYPPNERETYVNNLTPQEFHEYCYRKVGMVGDVHFDKTGTAYYIDDAANNARFIGLNTQCNYYELQADGTQKYPTMWIMRYTQAQFDFLVNKALVGLDDDTKIVVFGHVPPTQELGDGDLMCKVLKAFKDKTTYSGTYEGTASEKAPANQIPISTDVSGNIYNGKGYKDGYRFNSSNVEATHTGTFITGFIPVKNGDTVYLNGNYIDATNSLASSLRSPVYKNDKTTRIVSIGMNSNERIDQALSAFEVNSDGYVTSFTIAETWDYVGEDFKEIAYIRLNLLGSGEGCVVTVNEPIVEGAVGGYDKVEVDCDFTEAKGKLVGYIHAHTHEDSNNTSKGFNIIGSRCDAKEENNATLKAERVVGTITEQSFDVLTVTPKKIYATKIGAGSDRVIDII